MKRNLAALVFFIPGGIIAVDVLYELFVNDTYWRIVTAAAFLYISYGIKTATVELWENP